MSHIPSDSKNSTHYRSLVRQSSKHPAFSTNHSRWLVADTTINTIRRNAQKINMIINKKCSET